MTKKAVAKKSDTNVITFNDERPDYIKDSERGSEGVSLEDVTIPRIDVVQDLSPQHKRNKPEYIEGAEVGMLFNTVTSKLYEDKLLFVPVFFRKEYVIWKHQSAGGGFCGAFPTELEAKQEYRNAGYEGETVKIKNNEVPAYEVVDTAQHFGLIVNGDGSTEEVVISMSKSKMKVSRKFNSMIKLAGGDRFSRAYEVSPVEDQNAAGQDYWNLSIKQLGFVPEDIYRRGEKMYESIASGAVDVNRGAATTGTTDEAEIEEEEF